MQKYYPCSQSQKKKELALLWQGIDFEYFLRDANAQLFTRLAQAAQQNNLAQTLDEKIKENKNLAVLKFLLSIFQTEAQYQIIEILSKVSVGGFLATLDKAALMQLRSMRKVSLDS
ncbi:MAG: hypothetical protein LRY46_03385 [Candidatus Pacebacteria bacterium]|nr:hypothetical protein [Candidatus Paceibacterota bacterium]